MAAVRSVDRRIAEASCGRVSLRWLVPATFVGIGLRQLLREGLTVLKLYPDQAPARAPAAPPLATDT